MTVPQLRQLASDNGYALTATNKAGMISKYYLSSNAERGGELNE